jgi:hypothetical protein
MMMSEELKQHFEASPFALVCVTLDLGAGPETVLLVKSSKELIAGLKEAKAPVRVGWLVQKTEAGPVPCLCLLAEAGGVGELMGEVYFDLLDDNDRVAFQALGGQARFKVALYDEDMELGWLADAAWGDLERLYAEQAFDRAEELLEKAEAPDFYRARELFQELVSLERLRECILVSPPASGNDE